MSVRIKLIWNFTVQYDNRIEKRRPDVINDQKEDKLSYIIDMAVPGDKGERKGINICNIRDYAYVNLEK